MVHIHSLKTFEAEKKNETDKDIPLFNNRILQWITGTACSQNKN